MKAVHLPHRAPLGRFHSGSAAGKFCHVGATAHWPAIGLYRLRGRRCQNTEGAKLYFDAVNARGGVNGQKIEMISVDNKFDPKVTVEAARKLITNDRVLALFLNRGTPHSQALLPLLAEYKVSWSAPALAPW